MESVILLKSTGGELESSSLEGSSSEKVAVLECDELNVLISDSETQFDPLDSVSSTTECADERFCRGVLCPLSPSLDWDGETGESSPAVDQTQDLKSLSVCQTPSGSIFDPFAPGPQEMALAPNPKNKTMKRTKMPLRRRLIFDLVSDSEEVKESALPDKEDALLESICNSFLELIVLNQIKEISNEYLTEEDNSCEDFKTPTSVRFFTGVADTCPPAPTRPVLKFRKLDPSICRKLDFGSNLI